MMRSSPASSMQKTYDEAYLKCSTAVYFEKQNNEDEALKSWREALDSIYYHNAYRLPANYRVKNETEKALQDSLREMEMQCKERVDLLDALRTSRLEAKKSASGHNSSTEKLTKKRSSSSADSFRGSTPATPTIGHGTVFSVDYSDITRPAVQPRPGISEQHSYSSTSSAQYQPPPFSPPTSSSGYSVQGLAPPPPPPQHRAGRTPSPEKKQSGMLKTTLRPARDGQGRSRPQPTFRSKAPAASQAATLVWQPQSNGSTPSAVPDPPLSPFGPQGPEPTGIPPTLPQRAPMSPPARSGARREQKYSVQPLAPKPPKPTVPSRSRPPVPRTSTPDEPSRSTQTSQRPTEKPAVPDFPSYRREFKQPQEAQVDAKRAQQIAARLNGRAPEPRLPPPTSSAREDVANARRKPVGGAKPVGTAAAARTIPGNYPIQTTNRRDRSTDSSEADRPPARPRKPKNLTMTPTPDSTSSAPDYDPANSSDTPSEEPSAVTDDAAKQSEWDARVAALMKDLPRGVDEGAAKSIFNEVVIKGDEVHWEDVAGLNIAKNALKEAVVYPFLRPDLFMGLREPARGMLLFGPPGTGKTMLARAVATESKSTFFAISASSLTSKFMGESEKLVRALFSIAKALTPAIIFVDEIDSLLSARSGASEHEATRRIKTEFLIQWSDLAKAAAGKSDPADGDASRVLVLAATNQPWAIDEAARRRFVRRQYIPLPEDHVRRDQLKRLMGAQKNSLNEGDFEDLIRLTDGFSGSDITALAKDAAMGPLRSLGERLLHMTPDEIRPIGMEDFEQSLVNIRPSVSKTGLKEFEDWAREFGERGG